MAISRWDPFGDFRFPRYPMRRVFDMAPWGTEPFWRIFQEDWWPRVDVYNEGDDLIVKAEVPGVEPDDIELMLEEDALSIRGKRKREETIDDEDYYRMERSFGSFMRSVPVPKGVKERDISANYSDGILEVRIAGAGAMPPGLQIIPIKLGKKKEKEVPTRKAKPVVKSKPPGKATEAKKPGQKKSEK